jgi:hypothetical protein
VRTLSRSGDLLQNPNDSSRVNLNQILHQRKRTTYEPGVVVLTALQIIQDVSPGSEERL